MIDCLCAYFGEYAERTGGIWSSSRKAVQSPAIYHSVRLGLDITSTCILRVLTSAFPIVDEAEMLPTQSQSSQSVRMALEVTRNGGLLDVYLRSGYDVHAAVFLGGGIDREVHRDAWVPIQRRPL
jgi:hypothetical protein